MAENLNLQSFSMLQKIEELNDTFKEQTKMLHDKLNMDLRSVVVQEVATNNRLDSLIETLANFVASSDNEKSDNPLDFLSNNDAKNAVKEGDKETNKDEKTELIRNIQANVQLVAENTDALTQANSVIIGLLDNMLAVLDLIESHSLSIMRKMGANSAGVVAREKSQTEFTGNSVSMGEGGNGGAKNALNSKEIGVNLGKALSKTLTPAQLVKETLKQLLPKLIIFAMILTGIIQGFFNVDFKTAVWWAVGLIVTGFVAYIALKWSLDLAHNVFSEILQTVTAGIRIAITASAEWFGASTTAIIAIAVGAAFLVVIGIILVAMLVGAAAMVFVIWLVKKDISNMCEEIADKMGSAMEKISDNMLDVIVQVKDAIVSIVEEVKGMFEGINEGTGAVADKFKALTDSYIQAFREALSPLRNFVDNLQRMVTVNNDNSSNVNIVNKTDIGIELGKIGSILVNGFTSITKSLKKIIDGQNSGWSILGNTYKTEINVGADEIANAIKNVFENLTSIATTISNSVGELVKAICTDKRSVVGKSGDEKADVTAESSESVNTKANETLSSYPDIMISYMSTLVKTTSDIYGFISKKRSSGGQAPSSSSAPSVPDNGAT